MSDLARYAAYLRGLYDVIQETTRLHDLTEETRREAYEQVRRVEALEREVEQCESEVRLEETLLDRSGVVAEVGDANGFTAAVEAASGLKVVMEEFERRTENFYRRLQCCNVAAIDQEEWDTLLGDVITALKQVRTNTEVQRFCSLVEELQSTNEELKEAFARCTDLQVHVSQLMTAAASLTAMIREAKRSVA